MHPVFQSTAKLIAIAHARAERKHITGFTTMRDDIESPDLILGLIKYLAGVPCHSRWFRTAVYHAEFMAHIRHTTLTPSDA